MGHRLPSEDFRASRWVLDPDDFALGPDTPDPPPTDLVSQQVWSGVIDLPTDVSIRTSDHHGWQIQLQYELWEALFDILEQLPRQALYEAVRLSSRGDGLGSCGLLLRNDL